MGKASQKKKTKNSLPAHNETRESCKTNISFHNFITKTPFQISLIAIIGLIAYSNTFQVPFFFDDATNIFWNPIIKNLDNFFFSTEAYKYNPRRFVGYLTFALNYHFGGSNVLGYHIVNLCIHIINAILVFLLVRLTFKTPYFTTAQHEKNDSPFTINHIALFSGLLFVAHPLATQAVTYIVQRYTSLATLFYLLSLVCYIKARLTQSSRLTTQPSIFFTLSLLAAILGMKTKEIVFTLPIIIGLYEVSFFETSTKKKLLFLLPVLLTIAIVPLSILNIDKPFSEILTEIDAKTRVDTDLSRWDYFLTQMRVITTYIRLIFLPINQNLDYDYQVFHTFFTPPIFASFIFLISLILMGILSFIRSCSGNKYFRLIGFGILWFFITLSVESSFIPIVDVIFEHRAYLPSVGAFVTITTLFFMGIKSYYGDRVPSKIPLILALLVVIVLAGATYARNKVWQNEITLWKNVAEKSPKKERAHNNLGIAYQAANKIEKAIEQFTIALDLNPDNAEVLSNLGVAYSSLGYNQKAIIYFEKSLRLNPNAMTHNNLGSIYESQGSLEKASEQYKIATEMKPDLVVAHNNLGNIYFKKGVYEKAIEQFQIALKLKPDHAAAAYNIGVALINKNLPEKSVKYFLLALDSRPQYSEAHNNLGVAYSQQNNLQKAVEHFKIAVQQDPKNTGAKRNLEFATQRLKNQ